MTTRWPHKELHSNVGNLLKEAVFGFNDGVVSTFAIVAGFTGGLAEQKMILLGALATLVAGAFSMGLGTYLGSKSEKEHYESELKREIYEIENLPHIERQEIRDIYEKKGFKGELLEKVTEQIASNRKVWLETMMQQELGFAQSPPKPGINGLTMSISFVAGSIIPTFPYFWGVNFALSLVLSAVGLLVAGTLKTRFTGKNIFLSALETLLIGAVAAVGTYTIGVFLT